MNQRKVPLFERMTRKIARFLGRKLNMPRTAWWDENLLLRTVPVHGRNICYATEGHGPPVVLVHGFGTSLAVFAHQIKVLSKHFQVFAIDLLGHGFSEKPDIEYTPETYVDLLSGFLDTQGIASASFVGHSMGSLLSICLAIVAPERIRHMILLNGSSPLFKPERQMRLYEKSLRRPWLWKRIWEALEILIPLLPASFEKKSLAKTAYNVDAIPPEWIAHQLEFRRSKGYARMVVSTMEYWVELQEYEDRVREIRHPALLCSGEQDQVIPMEHSRLLQQTLPNATLEIIPGCGHMSTLERPEQTSRMILDFLSLPPSGS
jgi:pimeloyl-ACP methyl ester carboxylesterase